MLREQGAEREPSASNEKGDWLVELLLNDGWKSVSREEDEVEREENWDEREGEDWEGEDWEGEY